MSHSVPQRRLGCVALFGLLIGSVLANGCGGENRKGTPDSSKDQNRALLQFAGKGDVQGILLSLEGGADPNYNPVMYVESRVPMAETKLPEGSQTPLINAVNAGNLEAVKLLLRRGALPNVRTLDETPLHASATRGNSDIVWVLLEAGANPNARVGRAAQEDAMTAAAARGYASVVSILYRGGGQVRSHDLCSAVENGYAQLVAEYIIIGLDPRVPDCGGASALERAKHLAPSAARDSILGSLTSASLAR